MEEMAPNADSADEIQRLTRLFRYAQVGRCVSSVTHDVNNLLGAISAYAELVNLDENLGSESRRMLREIVSGVTRCSDLIGALTSVARKERKDLLIVTLSRLIDKVLDLRRYDIRVARIKLEMDLDESIPAGEFDKARIELAFLYLVSNAIEALETVGRKEIKVTTRARGDLSEVAIWNSSLPIDESVAQRMFEPFYSTHPETHLGLGLHLAREIARASGGTLEYDPQRGFVMSLPLFYES